MRFIVVLRLEYGQRITHETPLYVSKMECKGLPHPEVMTVMDDNKEASHDVDGPPEGADNCHNVCLFVGLPDLLP